MKNYFILSIATLALFAGACSKDRETTLQSYNKIIFEENFNTSTDNTNLNLAGWTNFAQIGSKKYTEQVYQDNGYAEFTSFSSGDLVNIAWLVSPQIDMDLQEGEILSFQAAQSFLRSRENVLEVLVSTNFDGINVANADWTVVPAIVPTPDTRRFDFIFSRPIDLSSYTGKLNFAFRVKGSGTNSNLTGTYQIDDVMVYHKIQE